MFKSPIRTSIVFLALVASDLLARPDVLLIVADDMRPDAFGHPEIRTPALDALAARSMVFTNAYCMGSYSGAVCAPSRAMLMSGRSVHRLPRGPFDIDIEITPRILRDEGWRTFASGKWHNGRRLFASSFTDGDSIFFGGMGSHTTLPVHHFDPTGAYPREASHPLPAFSSEAFATATVEFLTDAPSPWFAYLSFTAPHDPRTPPDDFARAPESVSLPPNHLEVHPFDNGEMTIRDEKLAPWPRDEDSTRREIADYIAMIEHMDAQIGRVLDALESSGRLDETWIIFCADHGLAVGSHGLMGKQNLYEHSMGAPLMIAGPGLEPGKCDALVYLNDVPPTIAEITDTHPPEAGVGRSLLPVARGEEPGRDAVLLAYRDLQRAVRVGDWKLIRYPKIGRTQVFDLAHDPHEMHDLADDPAMSVKIRSLLGRMSALQHEFGDEAPLVVEHPGDGDFDHLKAERMR